MGKHKGNPYGIRLIATSGTVLADMLRELDAWYGRTPADRGDGTDWHADAIGWKNEAEARGLELDRLNDVIREVEQQRDDALFKQANLELKATELTNENAALLLGGVDTNYLTGGLPHSDRCRETDDNGNRCTLARNHRSAHHAPTPTGATYWDSTGSVTVPAEPLKHIEPCNSRLWQTPDSDGINPVCTDPKNHAGPHHRNHEGDPVSWLITSDSNSEWGGNAIID